MTPTLRQAIAADAPTILELMGEFYPLMEVTFDRRVAGPALAALLADPAIGGVWLAELGPSPVGYAVVAFYHSLEFGGRTALLDDLYVREAHRGRGIGTAVLASVERGCREAGVRALTLEVGRENERARSLYLAFGFTDRHNEFLMKPLVE
jgi:GNAT superfamily N-acetyltransferase